MPAAMQLQPQLHYQKPLPFALTHRTQQSVSRGAELRPSAATSALRLSSLATNSTVKEMICDPATAQKQTGSSIRPVCLQSHSPCGHFQKNGRLVQASVMAPGAPNLLCCPNHAAAPVKQLTGCRACTCMRMIVDYQWQMQQLCQSMPAMSARANNVLLQNHPKATPMQPLQQDCSRAISLRMAKACSGRTS